MNKFAWNLNDLEHIPKNGIRVMSTFACGGGSSMGYKLAGCDVIAANDIDPKMQWHYLRNLHPQHFFLASIRDLLDMKFPTDIDNLDILDGSPPCSTFSMAGSREKAWGKDKYFREGQAKQVLSDLFFDYLDVVNCLRPRVAIAENVYGMVIDNARGYVRLIMKRFCEIGYRPQVFLINAIDCGVPQRRERIFFCAVRDDLVVPPLVLAPKRLKSITCAEACADLVPTDAELEKAQLSLAMQKRWMFTAPGNPFSIYEKRATGRGSFFNYIRLDGRRSSSTLTAAYHCILHWSECRKLTFREYKRLGSFPDDYEAQSESVGKYIVGMSVPPLMTAYVAREICHQWLDVKPS